VALEKLCSLIMSGSFLSSDWYRVAPLKLRKRAHVQVARHVYRNSVWYVLQDLQSGKFHRLSPQSYFIVSQMDGNKTIEALWKTACEKFPEAPPSQTEIIQLISQLHNADIIIGNKRPNISEVNRRAQEENRKTIFGYFKNPLSLRIPLFDPEPFLKKLTPFANFMFSRIMGLAWLLLMLTAVIVALMFWDDLKAPRIENILSAQNIAILGISYIFIKLLHEIGHGLAVKKYGGEVREIGIMMLVFFPVPYVDASQAAFFSSKYQRIIVSAAGVIVELTVAAIALLIWTLAEGGMISAIAYNLFLIGGISTVLFNGNPLLRFDGYFVFADFIESPNLGQRSNQYFWYICQRYILDHHDAQKPVIGDREEAWLFFYALLAFLYRMFVMILISLYVASTVPVLGIAIVLWSIYTILLVPLGKGVKFLMSDPKLDTLRLRALMRSMLMVSGLVAVIGFVPFPHSTIIDAVLDSPAVDQVRVDGNGFVREVLKRNGETVERGDEIIRLYEPLLDNELTLARAELEDARIRLANVPISDVTARTAWAEQVYFFELRLEDLSRRKRNLVVTAPSTGILALPGQSALSGRMFQQGEVIGSIMHAENRLWRAAAPADRSEFIDGDAQAISMRISLFNEREFSAELVSRSPEVTTFLDSFALSTVAGGRIILDPTQERPTSLTPVTNYTFFLPQRYELDPLPVGTRATIRISHTHIPIFPRLIRTIRQTFLLYFGS
jgi:putative peptide zinc metalloprotease protein